MRVLCPNCGKTVVVGGLGRKRLNISLKNICEALRSHGNVAAAAKELGCSQGYIFNALKAHGIRPKDIIDGKGNRLSKS
jgi:transcriptional regulator of acetoin/glycerol metabolism